MAVLANGLVLIGIGFILHWAIWRLRMPARHTRALLMIFLGTLGTGLALLHHFRREMQAWGWPLPANAAEFAHIGAFAIAVALAYIITYSAIEAESPTLAMILAIAEAGDVGFEQKAFHERMNDSLLVEPRIEDLVRDGHLGFSNGPYQLTRKGRLFIAIFRLQRQILGLGLGG